MPADYAKDNPLREAMRGLSGRLASVGLFSLFVNLLMLAPPLYMLQVYDRVLTSRSSETLLMLTLLLGWMFLTLGLLELVRTRIMVRLGNRLDQQLSQLLYQRLTRIALQQPGAATAQPMRDLATLRQFLTGNAALALFDTPWVPLYLALLFVFDPAMGILGLVALGVLLGLALTNELSTRRLHRQATRGMLEAAHQVDMQLRNAEVLRAMGMQPAIQQRWHREHREAVSHQSKANDRAVGWTSLGKSARLLFQSLMLGLGAYLAINNLVTPGMVIAGSIILGRALAPVDQLIANWRALGSARLAYRELDKLFSTIGEEPSRVSLPRFAGNLEVERLVVLPPGSDQAALKGVQFSLRAGESLAIIGGSGAGKSTLLRALLGLWPAHVGQVRLDGAALAQWSPEQLGPCIGYLPQDVELFAGTIAENIGRFQSDVDQQVVEAAKLAGADSMIRTLPQGYNTPIGPAGVALSGGQRQLVGLARALFGNPSLVVLDEPNANLDQAGEQALQQACDRLARQATTLVMVSHRRPILESVDRILVIENGQQQLFGPRDAVLSRLSGQTAPVTPLNPVAARAHAT